MNDCSKCGNKLLDDMKFCPECGQETSPSQAKEKKQTDSSIQLKTINKEIVLENSQQTIVKRSLISTAIFALLMILPFFEGNPVSEVWALAFVSLWLMLSSLAVAWMFKMRANKLETLINRENLLAHWQLTPKQKENYVNYLYEQQMEKNKILLFLISAIAIVIFGIFILIIDEAQFIMLGVLVGLILILSFFAFAMPIYYRNSNAKGDGLVLMGAKYAYINGYFHNWDFPLSGLSKIKIIQKPFYGIQLLYYYTDRTLRHGHEIFIPANEDMGLEVLVQSIQEFNPNIKKRITKGKQNAKQEQ